MNTNVAPNRSDLTIPGLTCIKPNMDIRTANTAISEKLLQVGAIKLNPDDPFIWASGWKSPIYCDNRQILSYPYVRDFIKSEICSVIFECFPDATSIAGVATAGIAWGAMAADQLKLPFAYVRPKPKDHGLENQIEGRIEKLDKVIIVEDLVSTGLSSLRVCDAVSAIGAEVLGMVAIFTYGFPQASQAFEKAGVKLITLTNYQNLIELASEKGIFKPEQLNTLLNWRNDPGGWSK